ncbi:hypothetical protein niasHT_029202 [Heterodera trifolii]|uniref:Fucosyltransferase n=1 Tax=Heterodera trifolii TaxID=157864 RepID=A0ABD2JZT7_9BILA
MGRILLVYNCQESISKARSARLGEHAKTEQVLGRDGGRRKKSDERHRRLTAGARRAPAVNRLRITRGLLPEPHLCKSFSLPATHSPFKYRIKDRNGATVTVVDLLLPRGSASLKDRAKLEPEQIDKCTASPLLLMWDVNFERNLRGCADWNCTVTLDTGRLREADAVFFKRMPKEVRPLRHQYFVHYSQALPRLTGWAGTHSADSLWLSQKESPIHARSADGSDDDFPFNMSFGYRMDTLAASPYGFAARLAPESEPNTKIWQKTVNESIAIKRIAMAWFVSNCVTPSGRNWVVDELRRHGIEVHVFGSCGTLKCPKSPSCFRMLDRDYFFYFAAENSICKDYLTEKIWDQGLGTLSVPVILRRSLAYHLLPPNSFIAVDDFASIAHLARHLSSLMKNPDKYFAYFRWRANFIVVPLNSLTDPSAERLFGVCQVCRLLRLGRRPSDGKEKFATLNGLSKCIFLLKSVPCTSQKHKEPRIGEEHCGVKLRDSVEER